LHEQQPDTNFPSLEESEARIHEVHSSSPSREAVLRGPGARLRPMRGEKAAAEEGWNTAKTI
jgi:hypothetical protein